MCTHWHASLLRCSAATPRSAAARTRRRAGADSVPVRPVGMRAHQYDALAKALAFDRKHRTATVRAFLDDFLGIRRSPPPRRAAAWWAAGAVALLVLALSVLTLSSRPHTAVTASNAPGTVMRDCPTCPLMTIVPAGSFIQGASDDAIDSSSYERPPREVTLAHAFAMSTNEVSVTEFREFAEESHRNLTGCNVYDGHWTRREDASWQAPGFAQSGAHPAACVSWTDAVAYAQWLSEKTGHPYRLPSASEWEYAARAGSGSGLPWSTAADTACVHANVADDSAQRRFPGWVTFSCNDGYVNTAPGGSFLGNAFGLNDMLGMFSNGSKIAGTTTITAPPKTARRELRRIAANMSPEAGLGSASRVTSAPSTVTVCQ